MADADIKRIEAQALREAFGLKQRAKSIGEASDAARSSAFWEGFGTLAGTAFNYGMLTSKESQY